MSLTVLHLNLMKLRYPFISLTLGLTFKLDETETNPHAMALTHTSDEIQTYSHVNSTQI